MLLKLDAPLWRKVTRLGLQTNLGAVSLSDLSKRPIEAAELSKVLQEEFRRLFGESESAQELTSFEKETADCLAKEKYSSAAWTRERRSVRAESLAPSCGG